MALQLSTGLRNYMLATGSLKGAMANGFIDIFTGTPTASANDAPTGTKLVRISVSGSGLNLDTPVNGTIPKAPAESWAGTNIATGTAGYWRYVESGDTAASSTAQKRIQGTCGLGDADMVMSEINLVNGAPMVIDAANFTIPAAAA